MSKAQLKKLLNTMDEADLSDLILQVYGVSKEAKEYLEFFVNPDIDAKLKKTQEQLVKELGRCKKGRSAIRVSHLRKMLKYFELFGPEGDMLCDLYFRVFVDLVDDARRFAFPATFPSACANYLTAMLELMRRYGFVEQYVQQIMTMIEEFPHLYHDRRQFRNALQTALDAYFATHPLD